MSQKQSPIYQNDSRSDAWCDQLVSMNPMSYATAGKFFEEKVLAVGFLRGKEPKLETLHVEP